MQYRKLGSLQEYILVAQHRPYIERFARTPSGRFELEEVDGIEAALKLSIGSLQLPLRDIYLDVIFGDQDETPEMSPP